MWCHVRVIAIPARLKAGSARLAATGALALLILPGAASADAGPAASPEISLAFPSGRAQLVGSRAVVPVECLGAEYSTCNGTLTLTTGGNKHKVPFAMIGGASQNLAVPLGSDADKAKRAVAVARTAQETGGYSRSSEVLRFR